ncbi:hypothetical protein ASA1KI_27480 [Opitutales bacterium ASA1]|nr:hypothetical protein ASA1KI_27480 [Opitutales bacterium ASA1]
MEFSILEAGAMQSDERRDGRGLTGSVWCPSLLLAHRARVRGGDDGRALHPFAWIRRSAGSGLRLRFSDTHDVTGLRRGTVRSRESSLNETAGGLHGAAAAPATKVKTKSSANSTAPVRQSHEAGIGARSGLNSVSEAGSEAERHGIVVSIECMREPGERAVLR